MDTAMSSLALQRLTLINYITECRSRLMEAAAAMRIRLIQEINTEFENRCAEIQARRTEFATFSFDFQRVDKTVAEITTQIDTISGCEIKDESIISESTKDDSRELSSSIPPDSSSPSPLFFISHNSLSYLNPVSLVLTTYSIPYPASYPSVCYFSGSAVILTGGLLAGVCVSSCFYLDLRSGQSIESQSMLLPKSEHVSVVVGSDIVTIAGREHTRAVERNRNLLENHPWEHLASLVHPLARPHAACLRGVIYILGDSPYIQAVTPGNSAVDVMAVTLPRSRYSLGVAISDKQLVILREGCIVRWTVGSHAATLHEIDLEWLKKPILSRCVGSAMGNEAFFAVEFERGGSLLCVDWRKMQVERKDRFQVQAGGARK